MEGSMEGDEGVCLHEVYAYLAFSPPWLEAFTDFRQVTSPVSDTNIDRKVHWGMTSKTADHGHVGS